MPGKPFSPMEMAMGMGAAPKGKKSKKTAKKKKKAPKKPMPGKMPY